MKFKALLKDNGYDPANFSEAFCQGNPDDACVRFLRARKLDVQKAYEMISSSLEWRQANDVDNALNNPVDPQKLATIRRGISGAYFGWDNDGRPIFIERTGKTDVALLLNNGVSEADIVRKHIQEMEYLMNVILPEANMRASNYITKIATILDVAGINQSILGKQVRSVFKSITSIDQNNYPETAGVIYIANVPWIFNAIYKVASTFLDENTRKKIKLLPASRLHELQENIHKQYLPQFLGGTHTDDFSSLYAKVDADIARRHRQSMNDSPMDRSAAEPSTPVKDETSKEACSDENKMMNGVANLEKSTENLRDSATGVGNGSLSEKSKAEEGGDHEDEELDGEIAKALKTLDRMITHVTSINNSSFDFLITDNSDLDSKEIQKSHNDGVASSSNATKGCCTIQ